MIECTRFKNIFLPALALILAAPAAYAAVSEVDESAFSPNTTVIDFDDFPFLPFTPSPEIPGFTATTTGAGVWWIDGSAAWENFDPGPNTEPGRNTYTIGGPLEMTFDARLLRVGFIFGGNQINDVPFETRRNGVMTGSFNLTSDVTQVGETNWYFIGFEDLDGIDSIWFDAEQNDNWLWGIFDLIVDEEPPVPPVPVPTLSTWSTTLAVVLFLLLAYRQYRRKVT